MQSNSWFARVLPSNQKPAHAHSPPSQFDHNKCVDGVGGWFQTFHLTMFVALCSKVVLSAYSVLKAGFRRSIWRCSLLCVLKYCSCSAKGWIQAFHLMMSFALCSKVLFMQYWRWIQAFHLMMSFALCSKVLLMQYWRWIHASHFMNFFALCSKVLLMQYWRLDSGVPFDDVLCSVF